MSDQEDLTPVRIEPRRFQRRFQPRTAIQAWQVPASHVELGWLADWCDGLVHDVGDADPVAYVSVPVPEARAGVTQRAHAGDWVVRSADGFRVWRDADFQRTYREVDAAESSAADEAPWHADPAAIQRLREAALAAGIAAADVRVGRVERGPEAPVPPAVSTRASETVAALVITLRAFYAEEYQRDRRGEPSGVWALLEQVSRWLPDVVFDDRDPARWLPADSHWRSIVDAEAEAEAVIAEDADAHAQMSWLVDDAPNDAELQAWVRRYGSDA